MCIRSSYTVRNHSKLQIILKYYLTCTFQIAVLNSQNEGRKVSSERRKLLNALGYGQITNENCSRNKTIII